MPTSVVEKLEAIVKRLASRAHSRPRKVKTPANTINALFMKKLEHSELEAVIEQMQKQKMIVVDNGNVSYKPPLTSAVHKRVA